jgi:hypothetical protein
LSYLRNLETLAIVAVARSSRPAPAPLPTVAWTPYNMGDATQGWGWDPVADGAFKLMLLARGMIPLPLVGPSLFYSFRPSLLLWRSRMFRSMDGISSGWWGSSLALGLALV